MVGSGWGGQGGFELRIEVFVKIRGGGSYFFGGVRGGRVIWGGGSGTGWM